MSGGFTQGLACSLASAAVLALMAVVVFSKRFEDFGPYGFLKGLPRKFPRSWGVPALVAFFAATGALAMFNPCR